MSNATNWRPSYDVALIRQDMAAKGWLPTHLAKRARVSDMTVSRFLSGKHQSPPTAEKLAKALGKSSRRYLLAVNA